MILGKLQQYSARPAKTWQAGLLHTLGGEGRYCNSTFEGQLSSWIHGGCSFGESVRSMEHGQTFPFCKQFEANPKTSNSERCIRVLKKKRPSGRLPKSRSVAVAQSFNSTSLARNS